MIKEKTNTKRKNHKIVWTQGSAEIISFTCCLPILIMIVVFMVGAFRYCVATETIQRNVYEIARTAVVCKNLDDATAKANAEMDRIIVDGGAVETIEHPPKLSIKVCGSASRINKSDQTKWIKGNYIEVKLSVYMKNFGGLKSKYYTTSIMMMIERSEKSE